MGVVIHGHNNMDFTKTDLAAAAAECQVCQQERPTQYVTVEVDFEVLEVQVCSV